MRELTNDRPHTLIVQWDVTTVCNYDCWYCLPSLKDGRYRWPSDASAFLDLFNFLAETRDVHLDLRGGEPTLWPKLPEFIRQLDPRIEVHTHTNGSRTIEWWSRNVDLFDSVAISFHPNTADPDHLLDVVRVLSDKMYVSVNIMAEKSKLDVVVEVYNRLLGSGYPVNVRTNPLSNRTGSDNHDMFCIDEEYRNFLKDYRFKTNRPDPNRLKPTKVYVDGEKYDNQIQNTLRGGNFKGWTCSAGINRIYIKADGSIYRGTCEVGGKIGDVYVDTNLDNLTGIVCTSNRCGCVDERSVTKYLPS